MFKRLTIISIMLATGFGQNQVLSLDGENDYLLLPNTIITTDEFTIQAWVYMSGPGGGVEERSTIFEQRDSQAGCGHSAITFFSETGRTERTVRFGLRGSEGCSLGLFTPNNDYGEWHHYSAVQDGNYTYVYVDGQLKASLWYDHVGDFYSYISHVTLGRQYHSGAGYGFLFGFMDEVKIWNYARTDEEIRSSMDEELSGQENGLAAYWDFEDSEQVALDKSNNGHNGAYMDGAEVIQRDIFSVLPDVWGDLNEDGRVSIQDVIVLIERMLGQD